MIEVKRSFVLLRILAIFLALAVSCRPSLKGVKDTSSLSDTITPTPTSTTGTPIDPTTWAFTDGSGANGINKDTSKAANYPVLTSFNSKLYAAWYEYDAAVKSQIRISVYNGNDSAPGWSMVDGNGANGINKNNAQYAYYPQLVSFNSKLYITWNEYNGSKQQIRASVYNGNDSAPTWTLVDGNGVNGINKDSTQDATDPQPGVFSSKLYLTWKEFNGGTNGQIRMVVYNGDDSSPTWTFVDGNGVNGINKDSTKDAQFPEVTVFNSKLYCTWVEDNGTTNQIRMAVYNGNDSSPTWTFVDGNGVNGVNHNVLKLANMPHFSVLNSKLYANWREFGTSVSQMRVAVYNGNDGAPSWTFIDGNGLDGLNYDTTKSAFVSQLTVHSGVLYLVWLEINAASNYQVRLSAYNGNDSFPSWSIKDGNGVNGLNKNTANAAGTVRASSFNNKLHVIWDEGGPAQIMEDSAH